MCDHLSDVNLKQTVRLLCVNIYLMCTRNKAVWLLCCDHLSDVNQIQCSEVIVCDHLSDVNQKNAVRLLCVIIYLM